MRIHIDFAEILVNGGLYLFMAIFVGMSQVIINRRRLLDWEEDPYSTLRL